MVTLLLNCSVAKLGADEVFMLTLLQFYYLTNFRHVYKKPSTEMLQGVRALYKKNAKAYLVHTLINHED